METLMRTLALSLAATILAAAASAGPVSFANG